MRKGRLILLVLAAGFLGCLLWIAIAEPAFPLRAPPLRSTLTPGIQPAPMQMGSYDVLGRFVSRDSARVLLRTPEGRRQLSAERGAVEVNEQLVKLGRDAFYLETYGNEIFFTDVLGTLDGPINLKTLGRAILGLRGGHTTSLQVRLDRDVTVGGQTFRRGTLLNTGLDVPRRSLLPLGMRMRLSFGGVRVGMTCAACHASVDARTGKIIEGAPNADINTGLLLAMATNSAAFFRQTGVDPTKLPPHGRRYISELNARARLPDIRAMENAVDADLLAWPPGNFDSTADLVNNPSQIPPSFTCGAAPYGWSGFAAIGWFQGLTTLNNNVHATNSDITTSADASPWLLGMDRETFLGVIFQNAARAKFRLPDGARPSGFFAKVDPTPGVPGMNSLIRMPDYPRGSIFMLDGFMANRPGLPVGAQLNGMSAYQNTLAPPPAREVPREVLERGAAVFQRAGCGGCHSGSFFTNNLVLPQEEIGTQPSRARALAAFPRIFSPPRTYPGSVDVPLPPNPPVLPVPAEITPPQNPRLAYALDGRGGYKVPHLIGLGVSAPYLHDGGAAAGPEALARGSDGWHSVARRDHLGLSGTVLRGVTPEPEASLRVLLDRRLRAATVQANRAHPAPPRASADGSGHPFWVDADGGFTPRDQDHLIAFLLSLDDEPAVRPARTGRATSCAPRFTVPAPGS